MKSTLAGVCALALLTAGCASIARPPAAQRSPDLGGVDPSPIRGPQTCAGVGTACASGNPGACNPGHIACVDGVPTCIPDVTSQPCYAGPPGTENVGVCKGGSQSCVGALGACTGQVTPMAAELCFNDLDDDCDGKVNNGCPDSLTVGAPRVLPPQGGMAGTAQSARCPDGAFVTRTELLFDDTDGAVAGLRIYCGTPTLAGGMTGYTLGIAPVMPQPFAGFAGSRVTGAPQNANCGGAGLVAGFTVKGRADQNAVFGLGMYCADAQAALSTDNKLTIKLAPNSSGDYAEYPYGTSFTGVCLDSEVLVGFDGRTSAWMTRIQPVCAPLTVGYQP
jgi:hypothetical protein